MAVNFSVNGVWFKKRDVSATARETTGCGMNYRKAHARLSARNRSRRASNTQLATLLLHRVLFSVMSTNKCFLMQFVEFDQGVLPIPLTRKEAKAYQCLCSAFVSIV